MKQEKEESRIAPVFQPGKSVNHLLRLDMLKMDFFLEED